jgi:hypothetical protein
MATIDRAHVTLCSTFVEEKSSQDHGTYGSRYSHVQKQQPINGTMKKASHTKNRFLLRHHISSIRFN